MVEITQEMRDVAADALIQAGWIYIEPDALSIAIRAVAPLIEAQARGADVRYTEAIECQLDRSLHQLAALRAELAQARAAAIEEAARAVEDAGPKGALGIVTMGYVAAIRALSPRSVSEKAEA